MPRRKKKSNVCNAFYIPHWLPGKIWRAQLDIVAFLSDGFASCFLWPCFLIFVSIMCHSQHKQLINNNVIRQMVSVMYFIYLVQIGPKLSLPFWLDLKPFYLGPCSYSHRLGSDTTYSECWPIYFHFWKLVPDEEVLYIVFMHLILLTLDHGCLTWFTELFPWSLLTYPAVSQLAIHFREPKERSANT